MQTILDSTTARMAVLNRDGIIVAVNESWRRFTAENSINPGKPARYTEIGTNYLDIRKENREAYEGILRVLNGHLSNFNLECPRHSPSEQKWFIMSVTPLETKNSGAVIIYYDITKHTYLEEEIMTKAAWQEALLSYANCAVIATTPSGVIQTFNPAAERMLGYKAEEMINKMTPAIIHDPSEVAERARLFSEELGVTIKPGFEVFIAKSRRNLQNEHEWIYIRKDGTRFPVLLTISALRNSNGAITGFLGMALDITERKRMEEILLQTTNRLSLATRAGGVGIWDWDIIRNILTWDDQMFALYGITRDYSGNAYETWKSGVFPEDMQQTNTEIQMALRGEKDFDTEFRVLWPNGTIRVIRALATVQRDASSQPTRMIGTSWDITRQKTAETQIRALNENLEELVAERTRALTKSEKHFRVLFEQAAVGVAQIDSMTGRFVRVNQKYTHIIGYTVAEMLALNFHSITYPDDLAEDLANMERLKSGEIHEFEMEKRLLHKNGRVIWVKLTVSPMWSPGTTPDYYIAVVQDTTEHKQTEIMMHERLKKSRCLYAIRRDMEFALPISEFCLKIITHLRKAMQFPEIVAAVIELDDRKFTTENYNQNLTHSLQTQIKINGERHGWLRVTYSEGQPFLLPEEQDLIDTIADDLGRWLEHRQAEQRIVKMATHDVLTGLPNRLLLQDRIAQAMAHDRRRQEQAAVLFIDLDHFKIINDSLGHDVGDLLLQEVAARLTATVRNEDTVARQGGDEFIVLLPNITNVQNAEAVAQKILDELIQPFHIHEKELHIGTSIGIALFPEDGKDVDTLLKNSDIAMYHAKENGRNNYQFFAQEMNQIVAERHTLSTSLRHALERDQLLLHFQPVIDIPGNKLASLEVLLRWQHPQQGLISPIRFIPLAEENGMIVPIGEWVLRQSCLQIKAWQEQGYDVPKLAVNISARQLRQNTLVAKIVQILNETGVEANCLVLEITESMLVENIEATIKTFNQLSVLGFEISIDDFGTGYSSLSYLKRYPINTLKIDQSFVRDVATDPNNAAIIGAIIAMAHSLKMKVLAEGVETEEQITFLTRQGCSLFQGFYFSQPLPATEVRNKLRKH